MGARKGLEITAYGDRAIVITRTFDAPRDLVFHALTDPQLLKLWHFGPDGWSMEQCEVDLQAGGDYRYVWLGPGGRRMAVHGTYQEVIAPYRIVATERFDDPWYPGEAVATLELTEHRGKTTYTNTIMYSSQAARDAVLRSQMEGGVSAGLDRLEQVLKFKVNRPQSKEERKNMKEQPALLLIDPPQIVTTANHPVAVLRLTVPRAEMRKVIGPGLTELRSVVASQKIATSGAWFTHHLRMDPRVFDFEIGLPVLNPVAATGRVQPGHSPARRMARTILRGSYENLGAAWGELDGWIENQGHVGTQDLYEYYLVGPDASPDPAGWQTELNRPLA